jgi:hypothetical protein
MAKSLKSKIGVAAAALLVPVLAPVPVAFADTSPVPAPPFASCPHEQFPHAGNARNGSPFEQYEVPFTAGLNGGYLQIQNSLVTVTLGGPINPVTGGGSIFANSCGLFAIPTQSGVIPGSPGQINQNFQFNNNGTSGIDVSMSITGVPLSLPTLHAFASASGQLTSQIDLQAASNGGMNVEFYGSSKATSDLGPMLTFLLGPLGSGVTLPSSIGSIVNGITGNVSASTGNECTIPIGNLLDEGVPSGDLTKPASQGGTGLTYGEATTPVHLTSQTSGSLSGQPITGPITSAQAVLVSNDFPVGAIDPNTPPSPSAPNSSATPSTLCSAQNAAIFNQLLGLPSPPGKNTFYAPGTFAIHTSE